jgi:hypothetical protein
MALLIRWVCTYVLRLYKYVCRPSDSTESPTVSLLIMTFLLNVLAL